MKTFMCEMCLVRCYGILQPSFFGQYWSGTWKSLFKRTQYKPSKNSMERSTGDGHPGGTLTLLLMNNHFLLHKASLCIWSWSTRTPSASTFCGKFKHLDIYLRHEQLCCRYVILTYTNGLYRQKYADGIKGKSMQLCDTGRCMQMAYTWGKYLAGVAIWCIHLDVKNTCAMCRPSILSL